MKEIYLLYKIHTEYGTTYKVVYQDGTLSSNWISQAYLDTQFHRHNPNSIVLTLEPNQLEDFNNYLALCQGNYQTALLAYFPDVDLT